jgi:hypothetical protein
VACTQAVYYRDRRGAEPVGEFIQVPPPTRAAKIDEFIEEHLNGRLPQDPPPPFPVASAGSTGDGVRADAAVARQGLRAAGGARRVMVPRSGARQHEAERFRVLSRARAVVRFKITGPAEPGALAPLQIRRSARTEVPGEAGRDRHLAG